MALRERKDNARSADNFRSADSRMANSAVLFRPESEIVHTCSPPPRSGGRGARGGRGRPRSALPRK
eukprot:4101074-Prymnesium_polylepis.1